MNKSLMRNISIVTLCALFSIFGSARDAFAQARKAGAGAGAAAQAAGKEGIAIRKVELDTRVKTPDYSSNNNEATTMPGDWTKVLVRFDTEAEWTDQLEMHFYILVKNPRTMAYTMFTGTFIYSDISKGRSRQAAVFLRPRTVERYGVPERAAVVIRSEGRDVAMGSIPDDKKQWWQTPTAAVRSMEGYVLDRSQTPFANIASDNYEMPKGK